MPTVNDVNPMKMATLRVTAPEIHIYTFSRLVGAQAGKWEKMLADLEAKEKIIYNYYQPLRDAIVGFTQKGGKDRQLIYRELSDRAKTVIHTHNQNPVRDNQECFKTFEAKFFPKIKSFTKSLLRVPQLQGTFFGGVILRGLPHMVVTDAKDRERYVCLYPSAWKSDELKAYLELLTIIIEAEFGAIPDDLWCMDLKEGKKITWNKSQPRMRQKCQEAARLYKRMAAAQT